MRILVKRKLNIIVVLFSVIAVILLTPLFAKAEVTVTATTDKTVSATNTITIAGNPDFYPYEYYDEENKMYRGLFPNLYALIGMETGYNFVYVDAGASDNRLIDAKTGNADIVSAYLYLDSQAQNYKLKDAIPVVEYELDDKTISICIMFGPYVSDEVVQTITEGFQSIPESEIKTLMAQYINDDLYIRRNIVFEIVIVLLAVFFVYVTVRIFVLRYRKKQEKKQAQRNEYVDVLTGLGNMKYFSRELDNLDHDVYRPGYVMAYIAFDISRVNKQYGEETAEKYLCYAAGMLKASEKKNEITARIAGGAFGVLRVFYTEDEVTEWARTLLSRINAFHVDFDKNFTPKFRCGIYRLPEQNRDKTAILKKAYRCYDIAAKKDADFFIYNKAMEKKDALDDKLSHEAVEAVKGPEIVQYLQPLIDAETLEIVGAESLARWKHPELGVLKPYRFVPVMIEARKIVELDMRLFEESCKRLSRWREEGKPYFISTNFTRVSLAEPDFFARIQLIASRYFFSHKKLIIEITEDSLADNKQAAFKNIELIKDAGFLVALDDLGSGFTFFDDLKNYPLDVIKIDRSMLLNSDNIRGEILMRGVIQMCKGMGMKIICEGVENKEQYMKVKAIGCDYIQGYYFYNVLDSELVEKVM